MEIILASASPRRETLMRMAGIKFTVMPCDVDETIDPRTPPAEAAKDVSRRKALRALETAGDFSNGDLIIVAADTLVYLGGRIIGKPADEREAFEMLSSLQGRRHTVHTGVTLARPSGASGEYASFAEAADVFMRPLTNGEIGAYIKTGEPMDKAGAYGVQEKGSVLIERVEGDFFTVVGLPMARLARALSAWGYDVASGWDAPG